MPMGDSSETRRVVGGELVEETVAISESSRLEVIRRATSRKLTWEFQQPTVALIWFRKGFHRARLSVSGRFVDVPVSSRSSLGFIAPNASVQGEFDTDPETEYSLVFFDPHRFGDVLESRGLNDSHFLFADTRITDGFAEVSRELARNGPFASMLLEGWSLHTLARLGSEPFRTSWHSDTSARLDPATVQQIRDLVEASLPEPLTIRELSDAVGYSVRHFSRAFRNTVGVTPLNFITERRLDRAKALLVDSNMSITEIAIECGFGQSQRLSTVFRNATGMTPRDYRRRHTADCYPLRG